MHATLAVLALTVLAAVPQEEERFALASPGLAPSHVDDTGKLLEDWGAVRFLSTTGSNGLARTKTTAITLEEVVPAVRSRTSMQTLTTTTTVFRAPAWPAGLDVVTVKLEAQGEEPVEGTLDVLLPEGARVGDRTASIGSRRVLTLPARARAAQEKRAWGHCDEASPLPGWAKPVDGFDPAFADIRAGMGGVPILYRFTVEPTSTRHVVLGFCESYWSSAGSRAMRCKVEGAPTELIDPLARWGQHRPGGLLFAGEDVNGDGVLEVLVLPAPGTADENPILNAIWVFPGDQEPRVDQVIRGRLNALAAPYVNVGGDADQSQFAETHLSFPFTLLAGGAAEMTFLVACPGGSAPLPDETAWTTERLLRAAVEVWRDWPDD